MPHMVACLPDPVPQCIRLDEAAAAEPIEEVDAGPRPATMPIQMQPLVS